MISAASIFVGSIVHCKSRQELEVIEKGFIIVVGSKILALGPRSLLEPAMDDLQVPANTTMKYLTSSQLLIPGFIDTHIHAPQYPNCGLGYDMPLLDWLNTYTYPLEKKFKDSEFSRKVYKSVVKKTLSYGTTTACYFGSLFNESCNILVDTLTETGQRALVGKVNMTTLAPEDYVEIPEKSIANTLEFIKYVHSKKSELVNPIITPRFALSLDMDTMLELGQIAKCHDLHIQTHISENLEEVEQVQKKFGHQYAAVYDQANLLTQKTILAHALYLTDEELKLIARRGSSISHCPDSNICLNSGILYVRRLWDMGIAVGLGTDISGGSSPSMLKSMRACLDNSIYLSFGCKTLEPLNYKDAFYLATLGGSEALSLNKVIGNFEVKKDFDALIIDMDIEDGEDYPLEFSPLELLQKFIYTGDDRNIISVYVAGSLLKG